MGIKLTWTGLTIITAVAALWTSEARAVEIAGAIVMIIGVVMVWLDK